MFFSLLGWLCLAQFWFFLLPTGLLRECPFGAKKNNNMVVYKNDEWLGCAHDAESVCEFSLDNCQPIVPTNNTVCFIRNTGGQCAKR